MPKEMQEVKFFLKQTYREKFVTEDGYERGRINERRALRVLNELAEDGVFTRVKKASKRQNHLRGIDLFGVVAINPDPVSPEEIRIPFQVKSSIAYARRFQIENMRRAENRRVIVLVVNDYRSDGLIREIIQDNVQLYLRHGRNYSQRRF